MSAAPILFDPSKAWHKHNGGACPVHDMAIVRFQFACGRLSQREYPAHQFRWTRSGQPFDIVGYKVISVPETRDDEASTWTPTSGGY